MRLLVDHAAFLAQVSKEAAERMVNEFENAADSLKIMPQRCPWLRANYIPKRTYRYLLFAKRYMLVFLIEDDKVFVEYVLDCRQDYGWLFH